MDERSPKPQEQPPNLSDEELRDWLESLDDVMARYSPEAVRALLDRLDAQAHERLDAQARERLDAQARERLDARARERGAAQGDLASGGGEALPFSANTPCVNTIPPDRQPPYPGNDDIERRIVSILRWNALAMVVRANREHEGIGGHISTYASAATLYEVAFQHFFKARTPGSSGDQVYFQGHSSPGLYARAFLEGRLSQDQLGRFRREVAGHGTGLSSYPHPWLMPDFWQFPTVSMGLGPLCAIYQARFNTYLEHRGIRDVSDSKVWCFVGDGETDEPETLGAISFAAEEQLDNLIFVVNCNLQRLDGPVLGNGQIVQKLERTFRGAGWNVIKVLWGSDWDPLFAADHDGLLARRLGELVDGESQKLSVADGAYVRERFFGKYAELARRVAHLSDEQLRRLTRGGHDAHKVYAAYAAAVAHRGAPSVVLAQTIKGYGLGEAGEGRNITHQQKKMNEEELRGFRTRFAIPILDDDIASAPFYQPAADSPEMRYLRERREALGGYLPRRVAEAGPLATPGDEVFEEFLRGSGEHAVSTTMSYVRILAKLLKVPGFGRRMVPIVPDEARTFGMEPLFRQCGIYSHAGQLYEPIDAANLLYYKEALDGQILEEGITEAGSMASFIAAGTAYATHGVAMAPFFSFYSMFGFQRVGDLIWAAADARARGFLVGGTAGRTTLAGEGLQHADGHSHLLALAVPTLRAYDPAFAFELAVIVRDGIERMFEKQEDTFYYVTVYNENYAQPAMPWGKAGDRRLEAGEARLDARDLRPEAGDLRLEANGPSPEARDRRPESGDWRPEAENLPPQLVAQPPSAVNPPTVREGILRGLYCFRPSERWSEEKRGQPATTHVHLLGSGPILREALRAAEILEEHDGGSSRGEGPGGSNESSGAGGGECRSDGGGVGAISVDVWSATSYKELHRDALEVERWNRLHPGEPPRVPYLTAQLALRPGVCVAATDYVRALPDIVARWVPGRYVTLGTDGFGRSDTREVLRDFFEVDARHIALAALSALADEGRIEASEVARAAQEWQIDPGRADPAGQ